MNNEVDNINKFEEFKWKYFLNIFQLSFYLNNNDIIQLSTTCKHLRLKLKSKFISKLKLMREEEIPTKSNKLSKRKQLITLLDMLKNDYLGKYNTVNHCIVWKSFNSRFARDFFNLFANITRLELYSGHMGDYYSHRSINDTIGSVTVLIEALYPLKKLESLTIGSELINGSKSCSNLFLKLPLSLKTLYVIEHEYSYGDLNFYPLENINKEYSNLKEVSIINNKMLSNMVTNIESLTTVTIFNDQDFCKSTLAKFFSLNPQLEKLTVPVHFFKCSLANSILQMRKLKQLNINNSCHGSSDEICNLPVNTSIEHLNISCYIDSDILVQILMNLKSIKVLEFSDFSFYRFMDVDFSEYGGRVTLLHLNSLWYAKNAISSFDYLEKFENLEMFDRVKFTNMFELDYYITNHEGNGLKNWSVCRLGPINSEEFTLININQE